MRISIALLFLMISFSSCMKNEPRRPVTKSKTYTLADTTEEMKKVNKAEELKIKRFIEKDSLNIYTASSNGYWFVYLEKSEVNTEMPEKGDLVELEYEIKDLNGNMIYSKEELGRKTYKVDKEDFIPALQIGIKTMKVGEKVRFVIPSYNAFGIVGDQNKIGINQSIISTVTLLNIKKENEDY